MSCAIEQVMKLNMLSMKSEAQEREALRKKIAEAACLELENYHKYQNYKHDHNLTTADECNYMSVCNPIDNPNLPKIDNSCIMDETKSEDIDIDEIDPEDAFYQEIALCCLNKKSMWRHWAIRLTLSPYFERLTMVVILINCVTLGLYDPKDPDCETQKCEVLEHLELFIYAYFVLEMVIKIIAFGFTGKLGYIAESWNRLDFFIVLAGTFELIYGNGEFLSSVRAVRVLRPLRAINRVPSIRILVTLLLDTLPMLGNVFILCVLILMVFAIIGVQLWQGILRNRCYMNETIRSFPYPNSTIFKFPDLNSFYTVPDGQPWDYICSANLKDSCSSLIKKSMPINGDPNGNCNHTIDSYLSKHYFYKNVTANTTDCINWSQYYVTCLPNASNPHYGAISFDNTGIAFIAIFQAITLEGWVDIMYYLQDAYSSWVWIYFVTLIVLGSYFLTNLCLVVVATQFSETRQRESALMAAARKRSKSGSMTTFTISEGGNKGCYNQILSILHYYILRTCRKLKKRIFRKKYQKTLTKKRQHKREMDTSSVHFHHHHHHHIHHHHVHLCPNAPPVDKNINNNDNNVTVTDMKARNIPAIMPTPAICINDVSEKELLQPISTLPINTAALIMPDTTVVICHSSSLPDSLKSQSPLTSVALYPSLSTVRKASHESMHAGETLNLGASYQCVGDVGCCSPHFNNDETNCYGRQACVSDTESSECEEKEREPTFFKRKRTTIKNWCESQYFKVFIMVAIFLNTVTMSMEHHNQPEMMTFALEIFNTIFTAIFTIEMLMKLTGFGIYGYIKDAFNVFDAIVVIISIIEMVEDNQGGVSVLRTFRLMRIFKLVRFLPTLQKQIQVMLETLDSVMTFLGLLTIFIFTSAILGMHLFGGKMKDIDGGPVRHNFDDLRWSLITVFQVLTQEDWNQVLYDAMRSTTQWASVYFIFLMIIGNYVLFNLLVAILVEGFSTDTEGILSSPLKSPLMMSRMGSLEEKSNKDEDKDYLNQSQNKGHTKSLPNISDKTLLMRDECDSRDATGQETGFSNHHRKKSVSESAIHRQVRFSEPVMVTSPPPQSPLKEPNSHPYQTGDDSIALLEKSSNDKKKSGCTCLQNRRDYVLYLVSPNNKLRIATQNMLSNQWFDNVILFFILLNCVIMAMERPGINPESTERKIIDYSNHVFTGVFFIEMCIKIFASGFCFGDTAYLKNNWNRIDFILVIVSVADIIVTYIVRSKSSVLGVLKVFRAFRTLRPLRVISRAPGLKIVVETLIASLTPIGNLVVVALVFFTIFGILGVQLFKGTFYYCKKDTLPSGKAVFNQSECINAGYEWVNKKYNFDNLLKALFTLFVFATKDGWVSLMYDGIDAVDVGYQPQKNHNPWAFLYFVAFLLIAGFVVINMVVGVIIDNFQKCRVMVEDEMDESQLEVYHHHGQSEEQHSGNASIIPTIHSSPPSSTLSHDIETKKKITILLAADKNTPSVKSKSSRSSKNTSTYEIPQNLNDYSYVRQKVYWIVSHYKFDLVIAGIIGLNVLFMALEFYKMPKKLEAFLKIMNYIFTAVFILEAGLKIYGFGPRLFFVQRWNQLDVVIVFLSIIGIIFEELNSSLPINPTIIRIMRVLRIARVLKILKAADGIQRLLNCVSESLPQVGNLSMLFLLIFFIFSALGIELFGKLDCSLDECQGISRHAHFKSFGYALLTLFRISTGDNWSGILKDCINDKLCREPCQMMPYIAPLYFAVFVLASQFVLVNVVVAVLMKQLEDAKATESLVGNSNTENYKGNMKSGECEENKVSMSERDPLISEPDKDVQTENFNTTVQSVLLADQTDYIEMNHRNNVSSCYDNLSVDELLLASHNDVVRTASTSGDGSVENIFGDNKLHNEEQAVGTCPNETRPNETRPNENIDDVPEDKKTRNVPLEEYDMPFNIDMASNYRDSIRSTCV